MPEQAIIEYDGMRMQHRVWIVRDDAGERRVLRFADYADPVTHSWEKVDFSTAAEDVLPTFVLPAGALEALMASGSDILPPDQAQAKHLADAIGVRDRLLAMAEHVNARGRS